MFTFYSDLLVEKFFKWGFHDRYCVFLMCVYHRLFHVFCRLFEEFVCFGGIVRVLLIF